MRLIVLRHGATAWNADRRIQGRADPPLSLEGRAEVRAWSLPAAWRDLPCRVSPLRRAIETAGLLGFEAPVIEPALIEMDWGRFEGRRLAELRAEHGVELAANEALGLDFRPPGGESPREVAARLRLWLDRSASTDGGSAVLVTHKGVRRAFLALATGWDMRSAHPTKLRDHEALRLDLAPDGELSLVDTVPLGARL